MSSPLDQDRVVWIEVSLVCTEMLVSTKYILMHHLVKSQKFYPLLCASLVLLLPLKFHRICLRLGYYISIFKI
jgi:hypothetical protein